MPTNKRKTPERRKKSSSPRRQKPAVVEEDNTEKNRPRTEDEIEEHLESIQDMLTQLLQLQERDKYIAAGEVENLRKAYTYIAEDAKAASRSFTKQIKKVEAELETLEAYVKEKSFTKSYHGTWRSVFHTPGVRRLQSLCMSPFLFFIGVPLSFVFILLFLYFRFTRPFMILYILFIFTLGRPKHPMRKKMFNVRLPIFKYYRDYFPIRLVVPPSTREKFDKQKNYLFAYHPHGVHTFGAILCFGTEANFASKMLPGIKTHLQTLKVNYFIPFWRWCMVGMGAGDASADCIRKTLRAGPGESVVLVVGGAEESLMSKPNSNDIVLQKRKGFIKIALQEGASLVPVYGFGENNAYNISTLAENRRMKYFLRVLKKYTGFTVPLISGRGFFLKYGVLPHRRPIVVVVGDPLDLPRIPHPTPEELDHWQQAYITALQKLYNQHRDLYDLESTGLRIIK